MMDYDYSPIDVINESGKWISTYRYEPYLKKWFYIEPHMREHVILLNSEDIPDDILPFLQKQNYSLMNSYYAPLKIQVQITKSCNYRCKMCYAYDSNTQSELLPRTILSRFLTDAKESGVVRINYVGGEPFMRNDFVEIVEETKEKRLLVSCITNGTIPGASPQRYQRILDQLFNIQISCNGTGKFYEYEYGCSNWRKASKLIATTVANTKTNILSFVVSGLNYTCIPDFLEFANSIHPSVVKFGTMCWSGNAQRRRSEAYYKDILPAARKLIAQGRDKYGNLKIQSQLDQGKTTPLWEEYTSGYRPFEFYFSPEGKDGLYLKSNGEYYPFPLLSENEQFKLGIVENGITQIWRENPILHSIREVTFENSSCGKMGCTSVCGLWNRSYAYSWTGDLFGKVPCELSNWK